MKARQLRNPKLSRAERSEDIKQRLFDAAAKVVGEVGYAEASVARITSLAGFAQGTFYNHFPTRQALLDELLPVLGRQMVRFIEERVSATASVVEQETVRFRAFFEFLDEVPEFLRILNEAEFFAPNGYRIHIEKTATAYSKILRQGRNSDSRLAQFSDDELEVVVHILMGARGYVGLKLAAQKSAAQPAAHHVFSAYAKLMGGGLFESAAPAKKGARVDPASAA